MSTKQTTNYTLTDDSRSEIIGILTASGFPILTHEAALQELEGTLERINDSMKRPDTHEIAEGLLEQVDAMLACLDALPAWIRTGLHDALPATDDGQPATVRRQLQILQGRAQHALRALPKKKVGRPRYDERKTQILGCLGALWFEQFPNDRGVYRNASDTEINQGPEYRGALLDFVWDIVAVLNMDIGSKRIIGERLQGRPNEQGKLSLQERIQAKVRAEIDR
jgi:hypothetical protein